MEDMWIGVTKQKVSFPTLFRVALTPFCEDLFDAIVPNFILILSLLNSHGSSIISFNQDSIKWW